MIIMFWQFAAQFSRLGYGQMACSIFGCWTERVETTPSQQCAGEVLKHTHCSQRGGLLWCVISGQYCALITIERQQLLLQVKRTFG